MRRSSLIQTSQRSICTSVVAKSQAQPKLASKWALPPAEASRQWAPAPLPGQPPSVESLSNVGVHKWTKQAPLHHRASPAHQTSGPGTNQWTPSPSASSLIPQIPSKYTNYSGHAGARPLSKPWTPNPSLGSQSTERPAAPWLRDRQSGKDEAPHIRTTTRFSPIGGNIRTREDFSRSETRFHTPLRPPQPEQLGLQVKPKDSDRIGRRDQSIAKSSSRDIPKWHRDPVVLPPVIAHSSMTESRPNMFKSRGSYKSGAWIQRPLENASAPVKKKVKPRVNLIKRAKEVFIPNVISVGNLSRLLGLRLDDLQRRMVRSGMVDTSPHHVLTAEYASLLAMEFDFNPVVNDEAAFDIYPPQPHPDPSTLPTRPPVVTIMGHVDHGKTTLLDTLRSASVAQGEAGGITQHIGAFSVPVPVLGEGSPDGIIQSITFLDTPGHAAFSAMRARGANVTDIIVLVVAADDGVMPQTKEVIQLIKKDEGKVSVVVAINKVDKPGADVDSVERSLLAEGIQLEQFGGDVPAVQVSGMTGYGLDNLVETISAVAELQDIRAEKEGPVMGYVLESRVLKGLGPVATVLILQGSLTSASSLISGTTYARVRQIKDSSGAVIKIAYPGNAVTVSGWKDVPKAGDEVLEGANDEQVKKAVANRMRRVEMQNMLEDVEAINENRKEERAKRIALLATETNVTRPAVGNRNRPHINVEDEAHGSKELKLIVKADVSGSVEAVAGALEGMGNNVAKVKIVQSGVGAPNDSDVMLANAVGGSIIAFNVDTPRSVASLAASNRIPIHTSPIIYRLMEEIKERVISLLPKILETHVTGEATVLKIFEVQLKNKEKLKVAGCRVSNGVIDKSKKARVIRNGETVHDGLLHTLKHLKTDVTEVRKGMECGLSLTKFHGVQEGDLIQVYDVIEKPGNL